ncbi:hypothetical protein KAR91_37380 [Candidatus Pacearchaeota archaeon]|nr:hypothetical protein [Candidatus Pacearchaeota archaeon]
MPPIVESYDDLLKSMDARNGLGQGLTGDDVVAEMEKALATTTSGPGNQMPGPLSLENLDAMMTEVLITEKHLKLNNLLPKVPSANTLYQFNKHTGFGEHRGSLGFGEGGGPTGTGSTFERDSVLTKFLGIEGGITHQMMTAGQNGGIFEDPSVRETRDRTLALLVKYERELVHGQKSIKDENGVEVNIDGLLTALLAAYGANIIDKEGEALDYDDLDVSAENLITTGKQATVDGYTQIMSPHVSGGLNKMYQERNIVRESKGSGRGASYAPGFKVPGYDSQFGNMNFDHSILLEEVPNSAPLASTTSAAPAAPTSPTSAAGAEATSKMVADTYYYFIAAFNDTTESLPAGTVTPGVAVTAGQKVTLVIPRVAAATGYRIYRATEDDATKAKWIGKIPNTASGDAGFVDLNGWRTQDAATGKAENGLAIQIKPDSRDICIAQLAPLMKMPLPQVKTTFPFMLLLYVALAVKAPERIRIYKNCGTYVPV